MKAKIDNKVIVNSENIKEAELIELIRSNPEKIKEVEQTPILCKEAVNINGLLLEFIKEQTADICEIAVTNNPDAIKYAKFQSLRMCEQAIAANPALIKFAQLQSDNMCKKVINADISLIKDVKEPSLEIWTRAALKDKKSIKWIKNKNIKKKVKLILSAIDSTFFFESYGFEGIIKEMDFSDISVLLIILDELYQNHKIKDNEWKKIKEITDYYFECTCPSLGSQILDEINLSV